MALWNECENTQNDSNCCALASRDACILARESEGFGEVAVNHSPFVVPGFHRVSGQKTTAHSGSLPRHTVDCPTDQMLAKCCRVFRSADRRATCRSSAPPRSSAVCVHDQTRFHRGRSGWHISPAPTGVPGVRSRGCEQLRKVETVLAFWVSAPGRTVCRSCFLTWRCFAGPAGSTIFACKCRETPSI